MAPSCLTHWGRVTHACVSKLTFIGSDNGLAPGRRQAIIWTNDGILLIRTLGTNFSEIVSEIHSFSFKKMDLKMSSAKWSLFCLGLNELNPIMTWIESISSSKFPWRGLRNAEPVLWWVMHYIMMLVKFLTLANQKHRIWSCDESGLCNPRPRLLGDEVVVGLSLMKPEKTVLSNNGEISDR